MSLLYFITGQSNIIKIHLFIYLSIYLNSLFPVSTDPLHFFITGNTACGKYFLINVTSVINKNFLLQKFRIRETKSVATCI